MSNMVDQGRIEAPSIQENVLRDVTKSIVCILNTDLYCPWHFNCSQLDIQSVQTWPLSGGVGHHWERHQMEDGNI